MKKLFSVIGFLGLITPFLSSESFSPHDYAAKIDALVLEKLKELELQPNPKASDEQFLRRATLGITGRLPKVDEVDAYLSNPESGKEARLINRLLQDPGYASHQTNWMSDIVRAKSKAGNPVGNSGQDFINWIEASFQNNMPYDEFVYTMLSSEGDLWQTGNAPVGYYMRDNKMLMDNLANSMQVFLGTRMQCAQCHDHPFDTWTQKNFYELAAFTNGTGYSNIDLTKKSKTAIKMAGINGRERENRNFQRTLQYALYPGIHGKGNGHIRLPHDYQYKDGKPGEIVKAKTPFGDSISLDYEYINPKKGSIDITTAKFQDRLKRSKGSYAPEFKENGSRIEFAKWVTSPTNPRFAKTIANRLWKRAMGMGLIEPVDDLRESSIATDPKLMTLLEEMVLDFDFDLKKSLSAIYYTQAFARQAQNEDVHYTLDMGFPGPITKRMSAEQIWDSLMVLRSDKVDQLPNPKVNGYAGVYAALHDKSAEEISETLKAGVEASKKGSKKYNFGKFITNNSSMTGSSMMMMDASMSSQTKKTKAKPPAKPNYKKIVKEIEKELGPRPVGKSERVQWQKGFNDKRQTIIAQYNEEKKAYYDKMTKERIENDIKYARASDMQMPARPGHFLFQLGQSTKETIQGSTDEANIPQVLTLMNGLEPLIYGADSTGIRKHVAAKESTEDKINTLFRGTLTRNATYDEMQDMLALVDENPKTAYQDILWVLVNTHEFKFIQ